MPHGLHKVHAAQHSFSDMRTDKHSRKPSVAKASSRHEKKEKKESLDMVAKQMSRHFDASSARDAAAAKVRRKL